MKIFGVLMRADLGTAPICCRSGGLRMCAARLRKDLNCSCANSTSRKSAWAGAERGPEVGGSGFGAGSFQIPRLLSR